jgi:hypothetical protein
MKIRLNKFTFLTLITLFVFSFNCFYIQENYAKGQKNFFFPGEIWYDTDGIPINAHGGGMLIVDDTYYWFGEIRGKYLRQFLGISCYSSKDLFHWKNEGIALSPVKDDKNHELHSSKIIERPKVVYNEKTKKYVMWMHVNSNDYNLAKAGVAVSDRPTGPYQYISSVRPNGAESRDLTLFKDDDGKAYLIHVSESNETIRINLLTDDYLKMQGVVKRIFVKEKREAPAIFKHNGKYFMITSGTTGLSPNASMYAVSNSVLGDWKIMGNPAIGFGSESTFKSQPTYVSPVVNKPGTFILMADRWNRRNLAESTYIWLPINFSGTKITIKWMKKWNFLSMQPSEYRENPQSSPIHINYIRNNDELDITKQKPDIKLLNSKFSALAWLGWRENKLLAYVLVYEDSYTPIEPGTEVWDQDSVEMFINYYQVVVGFDSNDKPVIVGGTGLGMGKKLNNNSVKAEIEYNVVSPFSKLVNLSPQAKGRLYKIEVSDRLALMRPFKENEMIAFALGVNAKAGKTKKKIQLYSPSTYSWADTDSFHRATFVKSI